MLGRLFIMIACLVVGFFALALSNHYQIEGELHTFPLFFGEPTSRPASEELRISEVLRPVMMFVFMLLGVLGGRLHRALRESSASGPITKDFKQVVSEVFKSSELYAPLIASPLVYAVVYAVTRDQPDLVIASLLAFENGFFCDTVLARRSQSAGGPVPAAPVVDPK